MSFSRLIYILTLTISLAEAFGAQEKEGGRRWPEVSRPRLPEVYIKLDCRGIITPAGVPQEEESLLVYYFRVKSELQSYPSVQSLEQMFPERMRSLNRRCNELRYQKTKSTGTGFPSWSTDRKYQRFYIGLEVFNGDSSQVPGEVGCRAGKIPCTRNLDCCSEVCDPDSNSCR